MHLDHSFWRWLVKKIMQISSVSLDFSDLSGRKDSIVGSNVNEQKRRQQ